LTNEQRSIILAPGPGPQLLLRAQALIIGLRQLPDEGTKTRRKEIEQ
jgi:hypothetical protein